MRITVILLLSEVCSHSACFVIYARVCVYTLIYIRMQLSILVSTVCVYALLCILSECDYDTPVGDCTSEKANYETTEPSRKACESSSLA